MSNYGGSQTYQDISGICLQRSRRQLLVPPGLRAELQTSPYPAYSQQQLDMRRKAEIFRYADPSTGLTAKRSYANLVNGGGNQAYTQELLQQIISGQAVCLPTHNYIPTPTSSCDVPGPPGILLLDPTVPLYNYVPVEQSGSFLAENSKREYITFASNDILMSQSSLQIVWTLYVDNYIPNPVSIVSYTLPFIIRNTATIPGPPIQITNAYVYSFYNSTVLSTNDTNGYYLNGKKPYYDDVPTVSTTVVPIDAHSSSCLLSVSGFKMPTNPGDIIDMAVVLITNIATNISILANPTGGSGLVFQLE